MVSIVLDSDSRLDGVLPSTADGCAAAVTAATSVSVVGVEVLSVISFSTMAEEEADSNTLFSSSMTLIVLLSTISNGSSHLSQSATLNADETAAVAPSLVVVVNREEAVVVGETEVGGVTMEDATADVEGRVIEVIALEVRLVEVTEDAGGRFMFTDALSTVLGCRIFSAVTSLSNGEGKDDG